MPPGGSLVRPDVLILAGFGAVGTQATSFASTCSCQSSSELYAIRGAHALVTLDGASCLPVGTASGYVACYPTDYGLGCGVWDKRLPSTCASREGYVYPDAPHYCRTSWCYVKVAGGCGPSFPSDFFKGLHYSYATCGSSNTYTSFVEENSDQTVGSMTQALQSYVKSARDVAASSWRAAVAANCDPINGCRCGECSHAGAGVWAPAEVALTKCAYYTRSSVTTGGWEKCLTEQLQATYEPIVAKENAQDRIGYLYFGSHNEGTMIMWPAMQWCTEIDFRLRPWYASGATGPKDVVMVIDTSGSMRGDRIELAIRGAKAVLKTLTDTDYVAIVRFSSASSSNSAHLQAAHDEIMPELESWIDKNLIAEGSTRFKTGFEKALTILKDSKAAGESSGCKQVILFLSDGDPTDWGSTTDQKEENYNWLSNRVNALGDTIIYTYALGSGLSANGMYINKRIACDNRGIFHKIPDGADLGAVMANYYVYFAIGQDSYKLRWRQYEDAATKEALLAGCMPVFDRTDVPRRLIGVQCVDLNTFVTLSELSTRPGYEDFISNYQREQRKCVPFRLSTFDVQMLRNDYAEDAVCDEASAAPGTILFRCGDGIIDANPLSEYREQCDDGNIVSNDGCSSTCQLENGYDCPPFGYMLNPVTPSGILSTYILRPQLLCGGADLVATDDTGGVATSRSNCREGLTVAACADWCSTQSTCQGFNFFAKSLGMTNGCCFRSKLGTNELFSSTECYERLPAGNGSGDGTPCMNDATFIDETGNNCAEWRGYPCEEARTTWGYTERGQTDVLEKCREACGLCSGAICRPACSVAVETPADCPDCRGEWESYDTCQNGNVVVRPGGRTECVVERIFSVTRPALPGGGPCKYNDSTKSFRLVDIFRPSKWSTCVEVGTSTPACGPGTQSRTAWCLASAGICSSFGRDYQPDLTQDCDGKEGCRWMPTSSTTTTMATTTTTTTMATTTMATMTTTTMAPMTEAPTMTVAADCRQEQPAAETPCVSGALQRQVARVALCFMLAISGLEHAGVRSPWRR